MREKKKQWIIASGFIAIITAIGITYAFINQTLTGTKRQILTAGSLHLELQEGNSITLENALPAYDEVGMLQNPYTFKLYNQEKMDIKYTIKFKETETPQPLESTIIRYGLTKNSEKKIGSLSTLVDNVLDQDIIEGDETIYYELRLWIDSNVEDENLIKGKSSSYKLELEATTYEIVEGPPYVDKSGANVPELTSGMIPVTYNEETKEWIKADTTKEWHDYDNQWWANAVTVTKEKRKEYRLASPGKVIDMNDINTMWVWIPRYEYQYTDLATQYAGGTKEQPGEIKIRFIAQEQLEPSNPNIYKIPEGFSFGTKNLSGFWIGKFETSGTIDTPCTNINCTTANLTVAPGKTSISSQNVSSFFYAIRSMQNSDNAKTYGFDVAGTATMDVHMSKNTEWGIVAMLSQSKYGKYGNPAYTGANKEIYQNKSITTGNSNQIPSSSITNEQVSYDTPDTGYGASTTGTIYGAYDMSGGLYEYVMGNYNKLSGYETENSGFIGTNGPLTGGAEWPDEKYYDVYTDTDISIVYKKGDATYETAGYYIDGASPANGNTPWMSRGGRTYADNEHVGIFCFTRNAGNKSSDNGTRIIITP